MFGFLTPLALLALGALGVPILIHMFRPRRVRPTPFSSLRWLRESQHRLRRRIKWHGLLLLALRLAFVTALVFALAKPVLSFERGAGKAVRFIVLDAGGTMAYRSADEPAPIEVGKNIVEALVSHVVAGDRTTVIVAGSRARALGPLVGDAEPYLRGLHTARAEAGAADFSGALQLLAPMIGDEQAASVELFFVTDNKLEDWSQAAVARFMAEVSLPVRVHLIQVGSETQRNAWIGDARLIESKSSEHRSISVRVFAAGPESGARSVRLTGLAGLPPMSEALAFGEQASAGATFELPLDYVLDDRIARLSLEPADALPSDDVYYLNLDLSWALDVLVIEGPSSQVAALQPAFHLCSALAALAEARGGSPVVHRVPADSILAAGIAQADVVILADVPALGANDLTALEQHVRDGAGLAIFLGGAVDPVFYNSVLHDPLRPESSLLPARIEAHIGLEAAAPMKMTDIDWSHPLLQGLYDPVRDDLAGTQFSEYFRLQALNKENDRLLARIGAAQPAIIERELGGGKVLLFNTTANDSWTDLPRRKDFVPLVDRLLGHLSQGVRQGTFRVGADAVFTLPADAAPDSANVTLPSGKTVELPIATLPGGKSVTIEDLAETGVYRLAWSAGGALQSLPFVVNAGGHDGSLTPVNTELLRAWWQPAEVLASRPDPEARTIALQGTRLALDPWMMFGACLVFMAEMFLVHFLCPRFNPSVSSASAVAERGFLA